MSAVLSARLKRFGNAIGCDEERPSWAAVKERRLHRLTKILEIGHVEDRVLNKHAIEPAASTQSKRPHVAFVVLALGIEPMAVRKHARGRNIHWKLALSNNRHC